ncbi:MAG: DoxX family protein [Gemmatimonadetes bacterium]|nr:DoxX family protein [Gemmatimonadota bacterium]
METIFGFCLIIGLFTRRVAFLASGEMAVTYFWMHWGRSGDMWWWENQGELPLLYSFIWLLFATWGGGSFSLDGRLLGGKQSA